MNPTFHRERMITRVLLGIPLTATPEQGAEILRRKGLPFELENGTLWIKRRPSRRERRRARRNR